MVFYIFKWKLASISIKLCYPAALAGCIIKIQGKNIFIRLKSERWWGSIFFGRIWLNINYLVIDIESQPYDMWR